MKRKEEIFSLMVEVFNKKLKTIFNCEVSLRSISCHSFELPPREKATKILLWTENGITQEIEIVLVKLRRTYRVYIFVDGTQFACEKVQCSDWFVQQTTGLCETTGKFVKTPWASFGVLVTKIEKN
jgi:hypothetical protein